MRLRPLSRRTFLRGVGVTVGLPLLEAMLPTASAEIRNSATVCTRGGPSAAAVAPNRMIIVYMPNGVHTPYWVPAQEGASYRLSQSLQPLERFKSDFLVLSNLTLDKAK